MECSPTCGSVQVAYVLPGHVCVMLSQEDDVQASAERIIVMLQPEETFSAKNYLHELRCHLHKIIKQKLVM